MKKILLSFSLCSLAFIVNADPGPWTQKSNIPAEGRHRTTGWSIGSKGYIGLGHYNSGPNGNVTFADIWEYDPSLDSWTQKADYGGGSTYGAAAFSVGNKAYVGAHVYGQSDWHEFDPVANTWTPIAPCPIASSDRTAFAIGDLGYYVGNSQICSYDPQTQQWTVLSNTPTGFFSWSKSFVVAEKGYVIGSSSKAVYEYKPATDQWAYRGVFPGEAIGGWSCFGIGDKGYVVSGYINFLNPTSRQCWEYDPNMNTWQMVEELPGSTRRFSSGFAIGNRGYIGTGTNGTNMNDFWEFNPELMASNMELNELVVQAFPNPSNEYIQITSPNLNNGRLEIYNLSGQLIFQEQNINQEITIYKSDLGLGTFIYKIQSDNNSTTGKIQFI